MIQNVQENSRALPRFLIQQVLEVGLSSLDQGCFESSVYRTYQAQEMAKAFAEQGVMKDIETSIASLLQLQDTSHAAS